MLALSSRVSGAIKPRHGSESLTRKVKGILRTREIYSPAWPSRHESGTAAKRSSDVDTQVAHDEQRAISGSKLLAVYPPDKTPRKWSKEEIDTLQMCRKQGMRLAEIRAKHLPHRTPGAVANKAHLHGASRSIVWPKAETELLRNMRNAGHTFQTIQKMLPHRTIAALHARSNVDNTSATSDLRQDWREEDDEVILEARRHGMSTSEIQKTMFPTRTLRACQYRVGRLVLLGRISSNENPLVTAQDKELLREMHARGESVGRISEALGRSPQMVRKIHYGLGLTINRTKWRWSSWTQADDSILSENLGQYKRRDLNAIQAKMPHHSKDAIKVRMTHLRRQLGLKSVARKWESAEDEALLLLELRRGDGESTLSRAKIAQQLGRTVCAINNRLDRWRDLKRIRPGPWGEGMHEQAKTEPVVDIKPQD